MTTTISRHWDVILSVIHLCDKVREIDSNQRETEDNIALIEDKIISLVRRLLHEFDISCVTVKYLDPVVTRIYASI